VRATVVQFKRLNIVYHVARKRNDPKISPSHVRFNVSKCTKRYLHGTIEARNGFTRNHNILMKGAGGKRNLCFVASKNPDNREISLGLSASS